VSNIAQDAPHMRHAMDCAWSRRCRNAAFAKAACILGWALSPAALRTVISATISLLTTAAWTSGQAGPPGLYEITSETVMPHLEENLRYAKTRERRCMRDQSVAALFPILQHQSLNGCKLGAGNRSHDGVYYSLICVDGQGTTGAAELHTVADNIHGVLEIQMGGKNMTFSQRIAAMRQGDCDLQL
jgi:hypothetical protein